jgi:hypothetical protein
MPNNLLFFYLLLFLNNDSCFETTLSKPVVLIRVLVESFTTYSLIANRELWEDSILWNILVMLGSLSFLCKSFLYHFETVVCFDGQWSSDFPKKIHFKMIGSSIDRQAFICSRRQLTSHILSTNLIQESVLNQCVWSSNRLNQVWPFFCFNLIRNNAGQPWDRKKKVQVGKSSSQTNILKPARPIELRVRLFK